MSSHFNWFSPLRQPCVQLKQVKKKNLKQSTNKQTAAVNNNIMAIDNRRPLLLCFVNLIVLIGNCYANGSSSIGGVIGVGTGGGDTFFPDWGLGGARTAQPTCLDIPRNLSLCHGIRYSKMRLPNLLDHDSMAEVIQQAASWVPLLNVRCHADTQLFLCSLFRFLIT